MDRSALRTEAVKIHRGGDLSAAARKYAAYLAKYPDDAGIWSNLGVLHRKAGRHQIALRAHQKAVELAPADVGCLNNLSNVLSDIGSYDLSIETREKILKARPDDINQLAMIGRCLRGKGEYTAAISHLEKALASFPDEAELQLQLAFALLGRGDYAEGFAAYDARWRTGELEPRNLSFPQWQGQDLDGKGITVLPEQGFGDAVLFMRFLPFLQKMGAYVRVAAEKPMLRLFQNLEGANEVVPVEQASEPTDYWVNMMDIAGPALIAGAVPQPSRLHVPDDSQARARQIVAPFAEKLKIGVIWSGSATYKGNAFRSFTHVDLMPLLDLPDVQIFSLYKGPYLKSYYEDGMDCLMIDVGSSDRDFADCAAVMREMDLIITSDTATAHVAGSLGCPTWVVLHWDPFWVWRHSGEETIWYPTARLFRQKTPLDWRGVIDEIVVALKGIERNE